VYEVLTKNWIRILGSPLPYHSQQTQLNYDWFPMYRQPHYSW
jgi:hypothetical protein